MDQYEGSVYKSHFAEIAPRVTGSISAISSALIIVTIGLSSTRLSSTYHRIMFAIGGFGIIASIAQALTFLPMPREGLSDIVDSYNFEGLRLGNTQTCNAQGFLIAYATTGGSIGYVALCVYYALVIVFEISDMHMRRIELLVQILIVQGISLTFSIYPLLTGNYYPVRAWCSGVPTPISCWSSDAEYVQEFGRGTCVLSRAVFYLRLVGLALMVISLGAVCFKIFSTKSTVADSNKAIAIQAIAYILVLCLTMGFPAIENLQQWNSSEILKTLLLVFWPLQGFWNYLIFISSKVYHFRRVNKNSSICQALVKIYSREYDEPVLISRLSVVRQENEEARQENEEARQEESDTPFGLARMMNDAITHDFGGKKKGGGVSLAEEDMLTAGSQLVSADILSDGDDDHMLSYADISTNRSDRISGSQLSWFSRSMSTISRIRFADDLDEVQLPKKKKDQELQRTGIRIHGNSKR